ncbi:LacI family DNA-binding transcriptional regulator [Gilvimarinus sp. SDUM040013]|uniref:LacI family DNA-binding transcriptional regulator n=1 Tax=Gilvimarinus gilvus TaxID=3058038 RepID=A0ABU4S2Z0_9GAMM|nr:LacI family DNA-binding transcriptional regulator [Gilvimarinus sp. SDUM040013]MDO3387557.1 LacI family DNA-binding transcriptional regulator [Gilvimarinus sp. SDUM040013]MDX6850178.1 LacI family DNA-binding transcriptional regulator [Gilvimarinus sp. SDUM040013]
MSNIRDVAKEAGVSVATVSRALSDPEKVSQASLNKVHAAIERVGYRPNMLARSFRSAKSYAVVVLVPDITNPFFSQVIRSIEDRAQQKGYAVLLGDTRGLPEREKEYIRRVETRMADGVIQLRPDQPGNPTVMPSDVKCVNVCGCESTTGPRVRIDNRGAARSVVEYLISLGHKRIGVISGLKDNPHTIDRLAGYSEALEAAGLEFDPALIAEGDYTTWSGLNSAKQFCHMDNRPSAVMCMNDEMAIGAIQTFKTHGLKVPENISVTGFDDISYARYCDPNLTTVAQPAEEMGKLAMDMLLRLIEGQELAQQENVLPAEFVIRKSTTVPGNK